MYYLSYDLLRLRLLRLLERLILLCRRRVFRTCRLFRVRRPLRVRLVREVRRVRYGFLLAFLLLDPDVLPAAFRRGFLHTFAPQIT